jgi:uncharacterized protein DUF3309
MAGRVVGPTTKQLPVSRNTSSFYSNRFCDWNREVDMLGTILIVLLILFLLGALPSWPYSRSWGYFPSGLLGLVLIIVIILFLLGRL